MDNVKEMICKNCGSSEFHQVDNKMICDYCKTEYLIEAQQKPAATAPAQTTVKKKKHTVRNGVLLIFAIGLIWSIIPHGTNPAKKSSSNYGTENATEQQQAQYGLSKISELGGGWTADIYNSITVATANQSYASNKSTTTYTGGMSYADLLKKVGNPSTTNSYGDNLIEADWTTDYTSSSDSIDLTITYDKVSGLITNKQISGYKQND